MLNHCNCSVSSDITPSLATCTGLSTSSHTPHPTTAATYILIYKCYSPTNTHRQLTAFANNTVIMSLLQAVEQYLGSINTWPAYIITYHFAETPSSVVEELTAFFAGNAVPKTLAYRLYSACNPEAANELVRQLFYARCSLWHSSDTVRRHSMYYNVRIKKHVRLNVPYSTELCDLGDNQVPVPDRPAPKLGVENTATPMMINAALRLVSQKQL